MTAYYAQPAAANYHTPPAHSIRQRGYRICDQCGAAESPSVSRFRLCGGCMTTQYCSPDCQKMHWPSHKAICQHTANQVSAVRQPSGYGGENHTAALLGWAGFQALQLKRIPANVRQNALLVELSPTNHAESHRRFSIAATHVVPRTVHLRSTRHRGHPAPRGSAAGTRVASAPPVIIIQCGGVSQVMPVEVDPPSKISWDARDDWAHVLHHFVESGRTDFQPISTTSRGVYYG
ncbi:hypothetical protein C8J57DRAFT_1437301 [Mycena rebaudengoi]|nr:hypothetical protein C8J57DRAFT_1437301 [Mycena rebaudengoi]